MAAGQDIVPVLERLTHLETVILNQRVSSYKGNTYAVLSEGEVLLNLIEEDHGNPIFTGGGRRGFHMSGVDSTGTKVFSLRRPYMALSDKIVLSMNDEVVSVVRMKPTSCRPVFNINDAQDNPTFRLKGKICIVGSNYKLLTKTKTVIGGIVKEIRDWCTEMISRKDDFIITFPADLALHFKLAVIAACVLIDFKFHEINNR